MYGEGNQETPWKDSIPVCHVYREYSGQNAALTDRKPWIPVYRLPISLPHVPGPRDVGTDSADSQRSMTTKQKHGYHPLQHEPAFPDDKFKAAAGLSCMLSVGAWFWEARNIDWHGFMSVFLCCLFAALKRAETKYQWFLLRPFFCPKETRCLSIPYAQWVRCLHGLRPRQGATVRARQGEALIYSLSAFILKFLCSARNGMTRIASYLT